MSKKMFFFNLLLNAAVAMSCFRDVLHYMRDLDATTLQDWLAGLNMVIGLIMTFSIYDLFRTHGRKALFVG
ncbi:hypothetical protein ACJVQT_23035 [Enterobacter huaxiensis]|uniref:hypothetical protein n=1 Tax=Enterobacter huaxiensis TaxID=2494702 RepID=UPI0021759114|nr:hypothetical protein [Enterobacter huaxiensis]MCS5452542.1 hypothetical protein [Enterobacter huaxiensis]